MTGDVDWPLTLACGGVLGVGLYVLGYLRGMVEARHVFAARAGEYGDVEDPEIDIAAGGDQPIREEIMPRRPLTDDQLSESFRSGGVDCPRCGNGEDNDFGDMEQDDDDSALAYQVADCKECSEKWRLVYRLEKVEAIED